MNELKPVAEQTSEELLELICQLAARFSRSENKGQFDALWDARNELTRRFVTRPTITDEEIEAELKRKYPGFTPDERSLVKFGAKWLRDKAQK